ncbi:MAG TPA: beta-ketoacyl synthase N-terminal-like domain-containing protein [Streptosporangiaceae bacterium]
MNQPIAIVGVACRYPDASSPAELWENVLAGRRAFRRIPDERLRLEDYWSPDPDAPDKFYARKAAVIDPFEIIGFAKTGALATSEMRVYDRHSNGFWPGEGCGMLVLMRQQDAEARGLQVYATIEGWGYSSDGKGRSGAAGTAGRGTMARRPAHPGRGVGHGLRRYKRARGPRG